MLTRASKNIFLTEDVYINEAIKKGEWRQLIVDSMTVGESKLQMKNNYSLDSFVEERLHFSYKTHMSGGNERLLCLEKMATSVRIFNSKMLMEMKKVAE